MKRFSFISSPNLPSGRVIHAVASGQAIRYIKELECCGITVYPTEKCIDILPSLAYHADMLFSHIGNNEYLIEKSQKQLRSNLTALGFIQSGCDVILSCDYPGDILLNSCVVGNRIICGKRNVHPRLLENKTAVVSSQGYAKCSVCPVDEHSVITDDESVYKACVSKNLDVLLVRKGCVKLAGLDYGFIGGCCGKISDDTVAFCGELRFHDDYQKIKSFLINRNVYPLDLGKGQLNDIGSIIPITEITE